MHLRIIEAGHHKLASKINGLSAFLAAPAIREHVVHLADATDSPPADRHGLRPRMLTIIGINAAVGVIGRRWPFFCRAGSRVKWRKAGHDNKRENPKKQRKAVRP